MRVNRRTVDWMCAGLVVVTVALAATTAFSVLARQRQRLQAQKALADQALEECGRAQAALGRLRSALSDAQDDLREMDEKVPESGRIGTFLARIDALMKQKHVVLVDLQPQASLAGEFYAKTPVRMSCSGAFAELHALLYELETMPRFVRMESVVMTRNPAAERCNMQLEISLFER